VTALPVLYGYRAEIVRWIDGDTVELIVDVGFKMAMRDHFRLMGVDTPERGRPGAAEAKARVNALAPAGAQVTVATHAKDKYGRWLAEVFTARSQESVNVTLLDERLAKPYDGGTKSAD
jgi:micrococcal nuclease